MNKQVLLLLLLCILSFSLSYKVEPGSLTVSGLSAGGFFAVQYHVAFSANVSGAAILAAGPYWCAQGLIAYALTYCMTSPNSISISQLVSHTTQAANARNIDPTANLQNSKVWLYSGLNDTTVAPGVVKKLQEYYANYVQPSNVVTVFDRIAQHAFPTLNYGNTPCTYLGPNYVNKCNYDAAGDLLTHLYGTLVPPVNAISGNILKLNQANFLPTGSTLTTASLESTAYVYVPTNCQSGAVACKLHVAFHGCQQTLALMSTNYVENTGYNTWAEANNIIVLYPQVKASTLLPQNPNGCFDWWGYTNTNYANKNGVQMVTVKNMVEHLSS